MTTVEYNINSRGGFRCAEEVVVNVIDDILAEGGHMLWQKYLQRKAFPFAAETATDVLVSQLRLCFVAHDRGEPDDETSEDWCLEPEPVPVEVDNWARMQLTVRRKTKKFGNDVNELKRPEQRLKTQQRTRISDARQRAKAGKEQKEPPPKSFDLKEELQLDDEEERLRDARQQEENRRRDRETKVRQNEKAKEEEQRRVQALHEEMSKRTHTFDSEGGLIWVEDLKLERLPRVQEVIPFFVKKDPRAKGAEETAGKGKDSPAGKKLQQRTKRRLDRSLKKGMEEDDFPDSYSKLQHGQPPILETMIVKPGVVLDAYGKSKSGPAQATTGGGMSRKEYVSLTEKEVAYEAQFASTDGDPGSPHGPGDPGSPLGPGGMGGGFGGPPGTSGSGPGGEGGGGDALLPPIGASGPGGAQGSRPGGSRVGTASGSRAGTASKADPEMTSLSRSKSDVQKAPPAPSMHVRAKKMQAIGHLGQPPRLHVAPLGGPYGFGVAQPPLGATMGHGLVRHGSAKDSYFFPHQVPQIPDLLRATSEMSVGPKGRGKLSPLRSGSREMERSQSAPSRSLELETGAVRDEVESPRHGQIKVEKKNPAYRGMRQTLFPNTIGSGYVAGMV